MRPIYIASAACLASALILWAATITVGQGAPNALITQSFINAYNRNNFSLKVTAPSTVVESFGSPGLIQEFTAAGGSNLMFALVKPDPNAPVSPTDTLQIFGDLFTYYSAIGVTTAGYPTIDTTACPANRMGTCNYQLFTKDYALFVYSSPVLSLSVADPFYTVWNSGGGVVGSFGVPTGAQTSVTSAISKTVGTEQLFVTGAVFSYPASSTTPSVYGIVEPVLDVFNGYGGYSSFGFPTSAAFAANTSGLLQQNFENGRIQWTAGSPAVPLFPVSAVYINNSSQGLTLSPGASTVVTAATTDTTGAVVTGRTLTWSTSNGAVATVAGTVADNGMSATVTAVGGGTANIYATAEGKTSAPLTVIAGGVCCTIGQGAPSQAVSLAFQAAVTRNQLAVALPASSLVTRMGTGYIQIFAAANGSGTLAVSEADGASLAYVTTGSIYAAYAASGGFTGPLGYPSSDPLPGPAQQFAGGAALAGNPVLIVPAPVAGKWFVLGGVASGAGPPVAAAVSFASYSGASGVSQNFANGSIYGVSSGVVSGKSVAGTAYFSTGPILARYLALSGPGGALGIPISDVYNNAGGVLLENFEGGYIDLQPGAGAAVEHYNPRTPVVTAVPPVVVPGGRVHVSAIGFVPGATLAFTITGQPGFSISSAAGAFEWDIVVPSTAKAAVVSIQATAPGTTSTASATYTITPAAALLPTLTMISGNGQTGVPGSMLAAPIVAMLQDSSGNALAGVPVLISSSPGAISQGPTATDQSGRVAVTLRLPPTAGVAVGSVSAGGQTVNFSALAASNSVINFPQFTLTGAQTPLVTALAALLAYDQNAGTLPSTNGSATAASLTQYLTSQNGFFLSDTGDSIANPWVAAQFAGAALTVEPPTLDRVRDLLNTGQPVVLNLNLTINGGPSGGTSVDATGVNADGSIAIADPSPVLARSSLADYMNGFTAQGNTVSATLASVLSVAPSQTVAGSAPFTVASILSAGAVIASLAGACPSVSLVGPNGGVGVGTKYCDGSQPLYELDFTTNKGATLTDLSGGGPSPAIPAGTGSSWAITRNAGQLTVAPLSPSIGGVTDSAGFRPAISPGGLFTIFGSGFSGTPVVSVSGKSAQVLAAFPFQINAAMPASIATGTAMLQVSGAAGVASASVTVSATSPGIFVIGSLGAILNSDGTLNSASNPAQRGQYVSIYGTGLGATALKAGLQQVTATTSVLLNGNATTPLYAGLVAGFVGLYQVNVTIPAGTAPNLAGTVAVQQGSQMSNAVPIAVD